MPLMGQMMQVPLTIASLLRHAARHSADTEIVSREPDGSLHRTTWSGLERRAAQLAQALGRLGLAPGDRVATLAWNHHRHLEAYYGTSGAGFVCHTVNPRLPPEQIAWIVADAADAVLCFDACFLPLVESLADRLPSVRHFVLLGGAGDLPARSPLAPLVAHDALLDAEDGAFDWPAVDEQQASSLCYTSGTTGHPKGVVYSHRSTVLHAYAAALPDAMGLAARDVAMPVVPMFHVNAWGLPYAAALVGCKLVLPGPKLDGASLHALMESEGVTFSAGVPTVWLGLLQHLRANGLRLSTLQRTVIGGSACPPAMVESFEDGFGVRVVHAWGMTELSPLGTLARLQPRHAALPADRQRALLLKQGKPIYGIDVEIVDDDGHPQPWDGETAGHLVARGPWVLERYFGQARSPLVAVPGQGDWFPTGDVATIDPDGIVQITDRTKDVIKSGGEWISSIALENVAMAHPAVHEAAAIACAHPKWDERPLLVVVKKPGAALDREAMLGFFEGRLPRWQVPDDVVFVDELPHTATGKVRKLQLRDLFRDHVLPD